MGGLFCVIVLAQKLREYINGKINSKYDVQKLNSYALCLSILCKTLRLYTVKNDCNILKGKFI